VTSSLWTTQGATLSHKNVCKEYGLTEQDVFVAIKAGTLQFRKGYAHGNPYYKLLRVEVEAFAQELLGSAGVQEQEIKHRLSQINKEINSLKRKLSSLERQRAELIEAQKQATA
jgi:predicted transcriptional regulator